MKRYVMKCSLLLAASLAAWSGLAHGEKADATKPILISFGHMDVDDVKQIKTIEGGFTLDRGTLHMTSANAVIKEDPEGYQSVVMTGTLATFRMKRDGGDLWVDGQALRVEYDQKNDTVRLIGKARIRRLEGTRLTDQVEGEHISYDSAKEYFSVKNALPDAAKPGAARGTMTIYPATQANSGPQKK